MAPLLVAVLALYVWLLPDVVTSIASSQLTDDERTELVCRSLRAFSAMVCCLALLVWLGLGLVVAVFAASGPFCGVCGT